MNRRLIILGIAVLLICVGLSGCVEETKTGVTAEEIKANMLQAIEDIASYKYSSDITATMTTIKESESNTTEILGIQNGKVDITNKKLRQDTNATTIIAGISDEQYWIFYIVDDILYSGNATDENTTWTSTNTSYTNASMAWKVYSALEMYASYLEGEAELKNVEVERLADEVVEGVDCYVLHLTAFENQSGEEDSGQSPIQGYYYYELNIKYWIAKDNYLLIKTYFKITSDSSGWYAYAGADRSTTVQEMETLFKDYNVPVTIELPPEAKD